MQDGRTEEPTDLYKLVKFLCLMGVLAKLFLHFGRQSDSTRTSVC